MDELIVVNDRALLVRPIRIDDAERLRRLFARLSPRSVFLRFFRPITEPSPAMLARFADVDHERRDALVALTGDEIVAVARYEGIPGTRDAEIAITVEDSWQHRGLGGRLARELASLARRRGFETFTATMLDENRPAVELVRDLSPLSVMRRSHGEIEARMPLGVAG